MYIYIYIYICILHCIFVFSHRMACMFSQSEAINQRKYLNNTGVPLAMKFSGIIQRIAIATKNNLNILSANH